jgi:hypothetical protein
VLLVPPMSVVSLMVTNARPGARRPSSG